MIRRRSRSCVPDAACVDDLGEAIRYDPGVRARHGLRVERAEVWLMEDRREDGPLLHRQSELLRVTLASIGDGVITTDIEGRVTSLNPVAAKLTGWALEEASGMPLERVFHIVNENTRQPVESPALGALKQGSVVGLANRTVLIAKDGTERPV